MTMQTDNIPETLAAARVNHQLQSSDSLDAISSETVAYDIQASATMLYPAKQIGYKIGATSPEAQRIIGCDGPFYGPLFDRDMLADGSTLTLNPTLRVAEAEFAFRIAEPFPDKTLKAGNLGEFVNACHAALEIVGRRTAGEGLPGYLGAIADFGLNAAFVVGDQIPDWQQLDLATVAVAGLIDELEHCHGSGAAVMGNPVNALLWLHESLRKRGIFLQPGQWVSTGTCVGVIPLKGNIIEARFENLGGVSVAIDATSL